MSQVSRREFLRTTAAVMAVPPPKRKVSVPTNEDDLAYITITDLSELLRQKKLSPVEVTKTILARIERLNPVLNAYITVTSDLAMEQARSAEREITAGKWKGPLHGVPISLKDNIDTGGVRTTAGTKVFAERIPTNDAHVWTLLAQAGACLTGKTNMDPLAFGWTSTLSHFGVVRNPWNTEVIAGGSSGGSAAATAAGLCYASLGTDTGASIRIPATLCGAVGLKPTHGRVSIRGVVPMSPSRDHVGPICRLVHDAAVVLNAIAGYDHTDVYSADHVASNYVSALRRRLPRIRLGVPKLAWASLDSGLRASTEAALRVVQRMTSAPHEVTLPRVGSPNIIPADLYVYHRDAIARDPEAFDPVVRATLEAGAKVDVATYVREREALKQLRRDAARLFSDLDVLVTPAVLVPPPLLEDPEHLQKWEPFHVNLTDYSAMGLPAIVLPCGDPPAALQIVGPPWGEARILQLAAAYEAATEWHKRRPPRPGPRTMGSTVRSPSWVGNFDALKSRT